MHTTLIMHEQSLEPIGHSRSVEREKRTLRLVPKLMIHPSVDASINGIKKEWFTHQLERRLRYVHQEIVRRQRTHERRMFPSAQIVHCALFAHCISFGFLPRTNKNKEDRSVPLDRRVDEPLPAPARSPSKLHIEIDTTVSRGLYHRPSSHERN